MTNAKGGDLLSYPPLPSPEIFSVQRMYDSGSAVPKMALTEAISGPN